MTDTQPKQVRWAIFGTGPVSRKFALDLKGVDGAVLQSVASRNPENAARFAKDLGVIHAADSYEDALTQDIDAVYIATPVSLHEAHAVMAINAGCAVLVEKPFAANAQSAERIAQAAKDAGVFVMEAMWTRFQPLPQAIRTYIASGAMGDLRRFEGRFLAANVPDPKVSLFNADLAGGALMHRGISPLSLARYFMGPIQDVQSTAWLGDTGVDEDCTLVLRHTSGALSSVHASLRTSGVDGMTLYGTKATLNITGPVWRPTQATILPVSALTAQPGGPRKFEAFRESSHGLRLSSQLGKLRKMMARRSGTLRAPFAGNGYRYEAQALHDALTAGQTESELMPVEQSLELIKIIDRAKAQWQMGTTI